MQPHTVVNDIHTRIKDFEGELKRVNTSGHIVKTIQIKKYNDAGAIKGVELVVDSRVSKNQIEKIVTYIKKSYNFDVCFYVKPHSIKVWYTDHK